MRLDLPPARRRFGCWRSPPWPARCQPSPPWPLARLRACTVLSLALLGCSGAAPNDDANHGVVPLFSAEEAGRVSALGPLPALAPDPTNAVADNPDAAWFGRFLFYDPRLSGPGDVACSTCHDPQQGWSDGLALSEAVGVTDRHAPTLWDTGHGRWFFWDGRCDSLWCQAAGPIEAGHEMASSRLQIAHAMAHEPDLAEGYEAVFGALPDLSDPARFPAEGRPVPGEPDHPHAVAWATMTAADQQVVTQIFVDVTKAIGAFERTILTGESPVDHFVVAFEAGDTGAMDAALSADAQAGLRHFVTDGNCHLCHAGPLTTNREFASVGLGERSWLPIDDTGRYDGIDALRSHEFNAASMWSDAPDGEAASRLSRLNQTTEQLGLFKVPSLRNVAESPPYMHGGHFETLTDVVTHYATLEEEPLLGHLDDFMVPLDWDDRDIAEVVAFLEAMSAPPLDPVILEAPDQPVRPGR